MTIKNEFSGGFLSKQITKDSLGQIFAIHTYESNNEGDVSNEKLEYTQDSTKHIKSFKYDYDEKGNWLKRYEFDEDGKIYEITIRDINYFDES